MTDLDDLLDELATPIGEQTFGASTFGTGTFSNGMTDTTMDELAGLMDELAAPQPSPNPPRTRVTDSQRQPDPALLDGLDDTDNIPEQFIETYELDNMVDNLTDASQYNLPPEPEPEFVGEPEFDQGGGGLDPEDELVSLMNELGGLGDATPSRAQPLPSRSNSIAQRPPAAQVQAQRGQQGGRPSAAPQNSNGRPSAAPQPQRNAGQSVSQQRPQQGGRPSAAPQNSNGRPSAAPQFQQQRNVMTDTQSAQLDELDSLMDALGGGSTVNTYQLNGTKREGEGGDGEGGVVFSCELDGLMDELAPNAIQGQQKLNTAPVNQPKNQPQQQQPAYNPTDDLLALMQDLEGGSRASRAPGQQPQARGSVAAGGGRGQPARAAAPSMKAPAGSGDDDLDEIMRNLEAPVRGSGAQGPRASVNPQGNPRASAAPQPNQMPRGSVSGAGQAGRGAPAAGRGRGRGSDLDGIMAGLNDEMADIPGGGRGRGAGRGNPGAGRAAPPPQLPPGVCSGCRKQVNGEQVQALGRTYHAAHFNCSSCGKNIGTRKCAHCGQAITNNVTTALNQSWHPNCFVCTNCLVPFNGGLYFEKENRPYCKSCFHDVFAVRCKGCNEAIIGNSLTALGASWHPHHFACFTCNLPLDGGVGFFERDGMPYCQEHYY